MESYSIFDVYTPTTPATITFVEREDINSRLVDALRTPGKQVVVFGPSGSGKTTLLRNKLNQLYENHITTSCIKGTTFEQILVDCFDKLDKFYTFEKSKKENELKSASIESSYSFIKSSIKYISENETEEIRRRVIPPQLTPQRLASFLGSAHCCWVIEDFHKIDPNEKQKLSQAMKVFMDESQNYKYVKIVAIGAVGTAKEVVEYDNEMRNRVAEIFVPLMKIEEIIQIISKGEKYLNISFRDIVKKDIVRHCSGLPSLAHQLALNLCLVNNIETTNYKNYIIDTDSFSKAVEMYIENESDTIKSIFDVALKQVRRRLFNNCELILKALAESENEFGLTKAETFDKIKKYEPKYPASNLTLYLKELETDKRGNILLYDHRSSKYTFSNPFHKAFARAIFSQKKTSIGITASNLDFKSKDIKNIIHILTEFIK